MSQAGYTRAQRALESAAMLAFAVLATLSAWRLSAATGAAFPAVLLAAAVAGWALVDLLSGLLHWALDSFGSVQTPLVGQAFIRPFREHHHDPLLMTRHDFVELNGASCIACLPLLGVTSTVPMHQAPWVAAQAVLLCACLGALVTNQCHQWAHAGAKATPAVVRWLQRRHLVLPPEVHRLHHTAPFDAHFCMACGWFNVPLNRLLRTWR
jgi:hypothetical protein